MTADRRLLAVATVVATGILVVASWVPAAFGPTGRPAPAAAAGLGTTEALAGLPPQLRAMLEAHARGGGAPTLADVLRGPGGPDLLEIPVPAAPGGPDPLGQALTAYARAVGAAPEASDLAGQQASLGELPLATQQALARLVLAYTKALEIQAAATSALDPSTLALARASPAAVQAWLAAHPGSGTQDALAAIAHAGDAIDQAGMLQAASLLARTIEVVRGDLFIISAEQAIGASTLPEAAVTPHQWAALRQLAGGAEPLPLRELTLADALAALAQAIGVPDATRIGALALPASLDAALALLVTAHADGLASHDPQRHAATVLVAMEATTPTLQAWAALLQAPPPSTATEVPDLVSKAVVGADLAVLASAAFGTSPQMRPGAVRTLDQELLDLGIPPADALRAARSLPPQAATALATILAADARLAQANADVRAAAGAQGAFLLAQSPFAMELLERPHWTADEAGFLEAWAVAAGRAVPHVAALREAQVGAAAATQAAADLLQDHSSGAPTLPDGEPPGVPGDPPMPVEPPVVPEDAPEAPEVPAIPTPCPADSPLSRCEDDVYLDLPEAGILVTGPGSTVVDGTMAGGEARIILDLGGDDVYTIPAATSVHGLGIPSVAFGGGSEDQVGLVLAQLELADNQRPFPGSATGDQDNVTRTLGVVLDVGGDDEYRSGADFAQGAASGLGTVGLLLDLAGDDRYVRSKSILKTPGLAQGAATVGGLAVLMDARGNDEYVAEEAMAQGIGITTSIPNPGLRYFGSVGIVLDVGAGADSFSAHGGQGYATGPGATGLLVDREGPSLYDAARRTEPAFQGGRARVQMATGGGPEPGVGLLVDLGGPGDFYSSESPPEGSTMFGAGAQDRRRSDDTAWFDAQAPLGGGIDSSLADADGDLFPDVIEMLAGADAKDSASTPATAVLSVVEALRSLVEEALDDPDKDGFANVTEVAWGTDPTDPGSNPSDTPPGSPDPGFLVQVPMLCPADDLEEGEQEGPACQAPCTGNDAACIALLAVGLPEATSHERPALLSVDLGGNDVYEAEVAGPGRTAFGTFGSLSLDLAGDDDYGGAEAQWTQAAAEASVAILVDLAGNDSYRASSVAQATAEGGSLALLADLAGDDVYVAGGLSQANARDGATAVLADFAGGDEYDFATQAEVDGSAGAALLYDAGGRDTYRSREIPVRLEGPDVLYPAAVHEAQGRVRLAEGIVTAGRAAAGAFLDAGPDADVYLTLVPDGTLQDVSDRKDGVGLVHNPVRGRAERSLQGGTAIAVFGDGLEAGDGDKDGWLTTTELLFGTNPTSTEDRPVASPDPDPEDPVGVLGTSADAMPSEGIGQGLLAPLGVFLPGLVIRGTGDDSHEEYAPFVIDLGGDDEYTAPNAGGTSNVDHGLVQRTEVTTTLTASLGSVAVLLDVGSGDDRYAPQPCDIDLTASAADLVVAGQPGPQAQARPLTEAVEAPLVDGLLALCPSLGGSIAGIAVAADDGGSNQWRSEASVHLAIANPLANRHADAQAWAVTQGASFNVGAGLLLLWDGTNNLSVDVDAEAVENDQERTPSANAVGLAQGASWGRGLGGLLSLGGRDDDYVVTTSARADLKPGSDASRIALAQGASLGGTGVLVDDGGHNRFEAGGLLAQGAAQTGDGPALGWLWSGPGDDVFESAGLAQAGARATGSAPAVAVLVDGGGSDTYRLARLSAEPRDLLCEDGDCAFVQGAALGAAAQANLVDLAGDDQYLAVGARRVQAAATSGARAALLESGGHDRYAATNESQAFSDVSGTVAVLADMAGMDSYDLAGVAGQGYGPGATFIDGGGQDVYRYGGVTEARNGSNWVGAEGRGTDLPDAAGTAFGTELPAAGRPSDIPLVTIRVARQESGAGLVPEGGVADGTLHVLAQLRPNVDAERVAILVDGTFLGDARRVPGAGPASFHFPWSTAETVDDGAHDVRAIAVLAAGKGPLVGSPDAASLQSPLRQIVVDNPPEISVTASGEGLSPSLGQTVQVALAVPRDRDWPSDVGAIAGRQPGAWVEVLLENATAQVVANRTYLPAGAAVIQIDGRCPARTGPACADGRYEMRLRATDAGGAARESLAMPLLVDGTPPASAVGYAGLINRTWRVGLSDLRVPVTAVDPNGTEASGATTVTLAIVDEDGGVLASTTASAGAGTLVVPRLTETLRLVTVAADAQGNLESLCEAGEASPCVRAKLARGAATVITTDFALPTLTDVHVTPDIVRPGNDLVATAKAFDVGGNVAQVRLRLSGALSGDIALAEGATGEFAAAVAVPTGNAVEAAFNYEVVAIDGAGNQFQQEGTGYVDGLVPRLQANDVHFERDDQRYDIGRASSTLVFEVLAEDLAVEAVDVSLAGDPAPCMHLGGPAWECRTLVPAQAPDGSLMALVNATDVAGNEASLEVRSVVRSNASPLSASQVLAFGPDWIKIAWTSENDTNAQVAFGTDSTLGRLGPLNTTFSKLHVENLTGLRPATDYYLAGRSVTAAGAINETANLLHKTTSSGYELAFVVDPPAPVASGILQVPVRLTSRYGADPVQVTVLGKDASHPGLTPIELRPRQTLATGATDQGVLHQLAIDTTLLADGDYKIVLKASRGLLDRQEVESGVLHVDNTPSLLIPSSPVPGAVVGATSSLRLVVTDPLGGPLPLADTLTVSIDADDDVEATGAYLPGAGPARTFVVTFAEALLEGPHVVTVALLDPSGNVGRASWSFDVDQSAPSRVGNLTVVYLPGPAAGRPGGEVAIRFVLEDGAGVGYAQVDLSAIGGDKVAMLSADGLVWAGSVAIPPMAPQGVWRLPIEAVDGLGNAGQVGEVSITVDATPPSFSAIEAEPLGWTAAALKVAVDEPAILIVEGPQGQPVEAVSLQASHKVTVAGLVPGGTVMLRLHATDGAGNQAVGTVNVTLPADDEDPSVPGALQAISREEGVAELNWTAASDNAGVAAYVVRREGSQAAPTFVAGNQTTWRDAAAPAGESVVYLVSAVDVAGREGPAAQATVSVRAVPHLLEGSLGPAVGTASKPFHVAVVYRHASGRAPDTLELRYGDLRFPLKRADADEDCRVGCRFAAEVTLPPRSIVRAAPTATLHAEAAGEVTDVPLGAPLVTLGHGDGVRTGPQDAPALPFWILATALALAFLLRRRTRP